MCMRARVELCARVRTLGVRMYMVLLLERSADPPQTLPPLAESPGLPAMCLQLRPVMHFLVWVL